MMEGRFGRFGRFLTNAVLFALPFAILVFCGHVVFNYGVKPVAMLITEHSSLTASDLGDLGIRLGVAVGFMLLFFLLSSFLIRTQFKGIRREVAEHEKENGEVLAEAERLLREAVLLSDVELLETIHGERDTRPPPDA